MLKKIKKYTKGVIPKKIEDNFNMKKPEKSKVVWYLALVAFFIAIWVIAYFSRH